MRSLSKAFALILLGISVSGCRHKAQTTTPQAAQAAPIAPATTYAKNGPPPPQMPAPQLPKIGPPEPKTTGSTEKPKPHKTIHHKAKPSSEPPTAAQNGEQASSGNGGTATTANAPALPATPAPAKEQNTTEVAVNNPTTDASPIGPLSEPGANVASPRRNQILDEINSTEKGLTDIKRPLTQEEQTTATQIRTFITKAREALNQEDLDGAHTLVTKAKVLLDELTK